MNKYTGQLTTILRSPDINTEGGESVSSTPGAPVGAAPAEDDFYSAGPVADGAVPKADKVLDGGKEDFTQTPDEGVKLEQQQGEQTLTEVTKEGETPTTPTAAPATLKLDAESIAALRSAVAPAPKAPVQQPLALTPQQLREKLNPVEVSADTLRSFGFENASPEQVEGFQNFANAVVKNAVSISRILIDQARKEVTEVLAPIHQEREQAQLASAKETFYSAHKDLAKYEKIVQVAAAEVSPTKPDGTLKTDREIMSEVATLARSTLKSYGVQLSTPANPGASGGAVPQPNKLSPNGRSGGDNNGQRGRPNDADADIYQR